MAAVASTAMALPTISRSKRRKEGNDDFMVLLIFVEFTLCAVSIHGRPFYVEAEGRSGERDGIRHARERFFFPREN